MKLRRVLTGIVLALALLSLPFLMAKVTHAQDQGLDSGAISSKLDQILNNQKALADQVASIRQELNIIKVRVTQAQ